MSESWERQNYSVEELLKLDNYDIISNVHQRTGKGGRPLILVNKNKYIVKNLTQTIVDIPWGIEVVWASLTPKQVSNNSVVKKIIVASMYFPSKSNKKNLFLDHITETYNFLSSKYNDGLYWIFAGDTNELKIDQILYLDPNLRQVVEEPTRINSDRILDPIITNLCKFYSIPECMVQLNANCECQGKPSDHRMILMRPISVIDNRVERKKREIKLRPMPKSKLEQFGTWLENFNWKTLHEFKSSHEQAEYFQNILYENLQK